MVTNLANGLALDGFQIPNHATMVVGTEESNAINVAIQLYADTDGNVELANVAAIQFYISDDSGGAGLTAGVPDGGIAIGTDGDLVELVADAAGWLISEADGDIDLDITDATGTPTFYLVLVLPTGKRIVSDAITFA